MTRRREKKKGEMRMKKQKMNRKTKKEGKMKMMRMQKNLQLKSPEAGLKR